MEYKGYTARVEFDDEAGLFHGHVLNLIDVITFQGTTVDELRREFEESVEDYLEMCAERGKKPEKPFSGKFVVRMDVELHRAVALAAARQGESLNNWVTKTIRDAVTPRISISAHRPAPTHASLPADDEYVRIRMGGRVNEAGQFEEEVPLENGGSTLILKRSDLIGRAAANTYIEPLELSA